MRNLVTLFAIPLVAAAFLAANRLLIRTAARRRRARHTAATALALALLAALVPAMPAPAAVHGASTTASDPSTAGPFATLLFSRTEITAADNCAGDDDGIARLDTTVAPFLQSLGLTATGTLVTGRTQDTTQTCTHGNDSLAASWADAASLASNYGWTFVSHTATYPGPAKLASLTPWQMNMETCGSAATITAHGLPGANGMIAYPGLSTKGAAVQNLQAAYGAQCFAWGREYSTAGVTSYTAGGTAPYWQQTEAVKGGPCNDPLAACYTPAAPVTGTKRYTDPASVIAQIGALQPGQWFTLQTYMLVTGTSPAYSSDGDQWDCTSADPLDHWTSDVERYCYSDWQAIVSALAARVAAGTLTVTDPLSVGVAFGRPGTYTDKPATERPLPPVTRVLYHRKQPMGRQSVELWSVIKRDELGTCAYPLSQPMAALRNGHASREASG